MLKKIELNDVDKYIFFIAIFLLPSATIISFALLIINLIIGIKKDFIKLISNKWNYPLILAIIFMPLIVIFQNEGQNNLLVWDKSLSWFGLGNWLPLFFCFLGLQYYIKSSKDRLIFERVLLAGSVPVIISGFLQYWFNLYGPFETLNGLIIWFQKPIVDDQGLSGLFNNSNYAGSWFCIVWPFALATFLDSYKNILNKVVTLILLTSITIALMLTASRNAWGGLILLIPLMTGSSGIIALLPLIIITSLLIFISVSPQIPEIFQNSLREIIPNSIWKKFTDEYYEARISRIEIWWIAIKFILQKPLIGWGAASFPILYFSINNIDLRHAHNLALELALSYGLPICILVFSTILLILFFSFKTIFLIKKLNSISSIDLHDRAWFSSFFVLFLSQIFDIQYFDGRISILFWLLTAGLTQIICQKKIESISKELTE